MFGTEFLWQRPALGTWTAQISLKIARYLSENPLARTPNLTFAPKNPLSQTWSKTLIGNTLSLKYVAPDWVSDLL